MDRLYRSENNKPFLFFSFVFLSLFMWILLKNSVLAPYNIEDDHLYISISNSKNVFGSNNGIWEHFVSFQKNIFNYGRYQPLFISIIFFKGKFLGTDLLYNHLIIYLNSISIGIVLLAIALKLNTSKISALITTLVFLTGAAYSEIFWRLSAAENHGVLFLLLSIFFFISYNNAQKVYSLYFGALFLFLASLCKESFIVLQPIIPLIPIIFLDRNEYVPFIKKHLVFYGLTTILFLINLVGIYIVITNKGKVFSYGDPLPLGKTILNNFIWLTKWFIPYFIILIITLIALIQKKKLLNSLPLLLFCLLFFLSQLIIYYKVIISFSQGRYIIPGALTFIFLLLFSLDFLQKNKPLLFKIGLLFISLIIIRNSKITYINSNEYAARANAYKSLIDEMLIYKPEKIAVYGGFEFFQSISTFFKWHNYQPKLITTPIIATPNKKKKQYDDSEFQNSLQEKLKVNYEYKTISELKSDSSVNYLITTTYEEWEELNYAEISKTFPHHKKITAYFSNANFGDLLNKDFWTGNLKNDKRTMVVFYK